MCLTPKKNSYICFSSNESAYKSNLYIDPARKIIGPSTHVLDLGGSMSSEYTFGFHISNLYKRCSNLAGWILRTFTMRDRQVMLTLHKSLVMSRLDYASQFCSPYLLQHVYPIEKFQRAFTKHITGMRYLSYSKRLEVLKLYSLQRRRDMALSMCGKLSRNWFQTSLILLLALSLIVRDKLALYVILVLVDWVPRCTIALDGDL